MTGMNAKAPRRWFQFSLRLLLIAFTAFAIGFPIWYRWPYQKSLDEATSAPADPFAAPAAKPIFLEAITAMSFDDARKIVTGSPTAATDHLARSSAHCRGSRLGRGQEAFLRPDTGAAEGKAETRQRPMSRA